MNSGYKTSSRKILYVVNPKAGTQKDDVTKVIDEFHEMNPDVEVNYLFPEWKNLEQEIQSVYSSRSFDTIVACGGDGTVRSVAEYVYGKGIRLGILPLGSANGLARNLNIPMEPLAALELILKNDKTKPISSLRINDHFSVHLADAGLNARIVRRFEHSGRRGIWGYFLAGLKVLRDYDYFKISIRSGKTTHHFNACMAVIANATMYGTGFVINNSGDLSDDVFEIIIIKRLSFNGFIKMSMNNWIPDPALIHVIKVKEVEIHSPRPLSLQVDGEYIGKFRNISAQINPHFIDIIIP